MVARIQRSRGLTVVVLRVGEVLDARTAPTGDRALKIAILMLAELDELQNGDRQTVTEN